MMRMRVFTITIILMEIAATVPSIMSLSVDYLCHPFVHLIGSHLHGFVYFPSQLSPLPSGCKQLLLRILSNPCTKKLVTVILGMLRKKILKQKKLLTEVILPHSIKQNLLSASDLEKEIVVVDGGDDGNPPICPPKGVNWCSLSVREGIHLHVQDKTDPFCGLTFSRVDGALPFAWLP
jgi:hypothetical protein